MPRQIVSRAYLPLFDSDKMPALLDVDGDHARELLLGNDLVRFACDASVFRCSGGRRCDVASGACVLAECHAATSLEQCQTSTCFVTGQPCRFESGVCDCDAVFTDVNGGTLSRSSTTASYNSGDPPPPATSSSSSTTVAAVANAAAGVLIVGINLTLLYR